MTIAKKTFSKNPEKSTVQNKPNNNNSKYNNPWWSAKHIWWIDALLFILGTILLGGLATLLGGKMFNFGGYKTPPYTAPKILFPIMWSFIYIAIGVSTFLMWRDKDIKSLDRKINLIL